VRSHAGAEGHRHIPVNQWDLAEDTGGPLGSGQPGRGHAAGASSMLAMFTTVRAGSHICSIGLQKRGVEQRFSAESLRRDLCWSHRSVPALGSVKRLLEYGSRGPGYLSLVSSEDCGVPVSCRPPDVASRRVLQSEALWGGGGGRGKTARREVQVSVGSITFAGRDLVLVPQYRSLVLMRSGYG
jgi:hypothetical protein